MQEFIITTRTIKTVISETVKMNYKHLQTQTPLALPNTQNDLLTVKRLQTLRRSLPTLNDGANQV